VMSWVVLATTGVDPPAALKKPTPAAAGAAQGVRRIVDARLGRPISVPVFERSALPVGAAVKGPALIVEEDTSTYVSPSFDVEVDAGGALVLTARREAR
jgi:N-methylhydantoinase A